MHGYPRFLHHPYHPHHHGYEDHHAGAYARPAGPPPWPIQQNVGDVTGALEDVTIGPHLISPIGMGYAWGQGLGLWGQREKDEVPDARDHAPPSRGGAADHERRHRRRDHGGIDWSTFAWAGLGVVGVFGAIYLLTRSKG